MSPFVRKHGAKSAGSLEVDMPPTLEGRQFVLLFLDIDGVLNSVDFLQKLPRPAAGTFLRVGSGLNFDPAAMIDPDRVERLNQIVDGLDVWVILSSTWRLGYELADIRGYLKSKGFKGALRGKTGSDSRVGRHGEIRAYLNGIGAPKQTKFAILDDDEDAGVGMKANYVRIVDGLEDEHVKLARRLLT